ncbi:MAG: hypothetical protein JXA37_03590 [Chloroflexia bacterium]|nr:hypothetical protein [Chloroflexia bacterium]
MATLEDLAVGLARVEERLAAQSRQLAQVLEHQEKQNGALDRLYVWQPAAEARLKRLEERDAAAKKNGQARPEVERIIRWLLVAVALGASIMAGYNLPQIVELFK